MAQESSCSQTDFSNRHSVDASAKSFPHCAKLGGILVLKATYISISKRYQHIYRRHEVHAVKLSPQPGPACSCCCGLPTLVAAPEHGPWCFWNLGAPRLSAFRAQALKTAGKRLGCSLPTTSAPLNSLCPSYRTIRPCCLKFLFRIQNRAKN